MQTFKKIIWILFIYVDVGVMAQMWRWKGAFVELVSPTFLWILGIELRRLGLQGESLYLGSHLVDPETNL